jgi:hypothetical protein
MEKVVVKPTWQLAWGLWWRLFLIQLGIGAIIVGISWAVLGAAILTWLRSMPTMPY